MKKFYYIYSGQDMRHCFNAVTLDEVKEKLVDIKRRHNLPDVRVFQSATCRDYEVKFVKQKPKVIGFNKPLAEVIKILRRKYFFITFCPGHWNFKPKLSCAKARQNYTGYGVEIEELTNFYRLIPQ